MRTKNYKLSEFLFIFILAPISFVLDFSIWIKLIIGVLGFGYILFVLLKIEKNSLRMVKGLDWYTFLKRVFFQLLIIAAISIAYVWFTDRSQLFVVMLEKSKLWIFILFFYSLFSVYPQELIYRTFFFQRYESLFKSKALLIFVNAIVFSLAHIFFRNSLVMILTFLGGIMFALTFNKTRSTIAVSIEHAIYGCWLFTVGMGEMLGFPT